LGFSCRYRENQLINGFEGSNENCVEVVKEERQVIGLDRIDSDNESNPSFVCDWDMTPT